ncbi:MAG: hypothetical protein RL757_902 [Bacteroidota bacterium]|jgi:hypothetical protein
MKKWTTFLMLWAFLAIQQTALHAQVSDTSKLFIALKNCDSLLFSVGFNQCDMRQFDKLMTKNLEFYHDKGGITNGKKAFIKTFEKNICGARPNYIARRELVRGSLQVFPLFKNGVLYGAIQMGQHRFYEKNPTNVERFTSIARFTHLWLLENGEWRVARLLSYDHQTENIFDR